jgi:hypothetical protein
MPGLDFSGALSSIGADIPANPIVPKGKLPVDYYMGKAEEALGGAQTSSQKIQKMGQEKLAALEPIEKQLMGATEAYREDLNKPRDFTKIPEYTPHKVDPQQFKDAMSNMMIFSLVGSVFSRRPMQGAMDNLNGAIQGYMKGDRQAAEMKYKEFEAQFKTAQAKRQSEIEEMKTTFEKHKNDIQALQTEMQIIANKHQDAIALEIAKKGDFNEMAKYFQSLANTERQAEQTRLTAERQLAQLRLSERRANIAEQRLTQQAEKGEIVFDKEGKMYRAVGNKLTPIEVPEGVTGLSKTAPKEDKGRVMPVGEVNKLEGKDALADNLDKLLKDFKPEYASLGIKGFGANLSLEAKRRLGNEKGQQAAEWWARYERLQAPDRHALFGSALTAGELTSYRKYSVQPSDDPKFVEKQLRDQADFSFQTANSSRKYLKDSGYRVPNAAPRDWDSTSGMPGTTKPVGKPAQAQGKYSVGQVIESGNKKYRVIGGDMNDPDVEEIK